LRDSFPILAQGTWAAMAAASRRIQIRPSCGCLPVPPAWLIRHCCSPCSGTQPLASASVSSDKDLPPPLPNTQQLSDRVVRILGQNPSRFTLTGTNMYLVGTGKSRILIDAGEGKPGVLQDLLQVMQERGCTQLEQIVITHWHHDHIMGIPELLAHFGKVPVRKYLVVGGLEDEVATVYPGRSFDPCEYLQHAKVEGLADGEVLHTEGATLRTIFTPGHAGDHVCLFLEEEQAMFTGDNVLGWGSGTFQDLYQYMASLKRMRDEQPRMLYPSHGPVVEEARAAKWLQTYIDHRESRIQQIIAALQAGPACGLSLKELTQQVYQHEPRVLTNPMLLYGACNNSRLVLDCLKKDGKCVQIGDTYVFRQGRL